MAPLKVRVAECQVDLETGEIWTQDGERRLTPKSAAVLRFLCERPRELVTSEELLDRFWTGSLSADNAVQKAISEIRSAFGDDARSPRVVRTVSKRGYILIATPESEAADPGATHPRKWPDPSDTRVTEDPSSTPATTRSPHRMQAVRAALGLAALIAVGFAFFAAFRADPPVESTSSMPPLTAIAVLPFDDLSPDGDQSWLANGLSEQLIESLSRIDALQVMARTSSQAVKREGVDATAVGERLDVGTLVEGSVRTSADQVRITAQLIRTRDASHLWSATYDRPLDDALDLQAEIGQEIAEAIREELGATGGPSWLQRSRYRTTDVRAFELVRRGVEAEGLRTEEGFREELRLTEDALAIDPNYAQAHAQQGFAYWFLYQWGYERTEDTRARADKKAREALALDPRNASANNLLVELSMQAGRWEEAEARVVAAIDAAPRVGPLRSSYAAILVNTGRLDEGLVQVQRAKSLDPLSPGFWSTLGNVHLVRGEFDDAIAELTRTVDVGREADLPLLLTAYHLAGRDSEGLAHLNRVVGDAKTVRAAYRAGGYPAAVRVWLESSDRRLCHRVPLLAVAEQTEQLRECVERLTRQGLGAWQFFGQHPVYEPYRAEPWFAAVLESYDLEEPNA